MLYKEIGDKTATTTEDGCAYNGCYKVGLYECEAKRYCANHYGIVILEANRKRVARSGEEQNE